MRQVKVLDCTLRDGGRIIDCKFSDVDIMNIACGLSQANIDIIEMGFLRDPKVVNYTGNSTFFTKVSQVNKFIKNSDLIIITSIGSIIFFYTIIISNAFTSWF